MNSVYSRFSDASGRIGIRVVLLASLLMAGAIGYAQEASIRAHIRCVEPGILRVDLVDEESFRIAERPLRRLEFRVSSNEISEPLEISFGGLTKGRYALRAYIDTNEDGRLNAGILGPTEPWALSWNSRARRGIPKFEDISFAIGEGVTEVSLEVALWDKK